MGNKTTHLAMLGAAAAGTALGFRLVNAARAFDFQGKVVLVTGGSRGLGLELSRELAKAGARLALCARDAHELREAERELRGMGAEVFVQPCDVTERTQVERFVAQVEAALGPVDVLVNNAGVIEVGPVAEMNLSDFDEAMRTHFWGPLYFIHALVPSMRARGGGRIVNIASVGGKVPAPHLLPYAASKFALVGLSEGLHAELNLDGIHVLTVCPGLMRTGSPRNAMFKGDARKEYAWFAVADSLPYLSISSSRAARQILRACRQGRAELILTGRARLASRLHGVAPSLSMHLLTLANRVLPRPGHGSSEKRKGSESESSWTRSFLTLLTRRAAVRNHETVSSR